MITLALIGLVGGLITGPGRADDAPASILVAEPSADRACTGRGKGSRPYLVVAGLALSFSVFTLLGTLVLSVLPLPRGIRIGAGAVLIALAVALTFNVTDALQRAIPDYTAKLNTALGTGSVAKALGARQKAALASCAQNPTLTLQNSVGL